MSSVLTYLGVFTLVVLGSVIATIYATSYAVTVWVFFHGLIAAPE